MDTIKLQTNGVKMIAHRGLSGIERENTYPAFVAAGNRSYFGIETDVHVTLDGKFVIIHDETTERVSLGKINLNVENCTFDEIKDVVMNLRSMKLLKRFLSNLSLNPEICLLNSLKMLYLRQRIFLTAFHPFLQRSAVT